VVLYGRDAVIEVARRLIVHGLPAPGDAKRQPPGLILVGPPGSGRTAVLSEIAGNLTGQPHVKINTNRLANVGPHASILDLLSTLVFDLVLHSDRRWKFSRFVVGRLVIAMDLDRDQPERAKAQVTAELARFQNPEALGERLEGLMRLIPAADAAVPEGLVKQALQALITGLTKWRQGRRVVLQAGQDWYGHQDNPASRTQDPIAKLVALNRMQRFDGAEGQARVVKVLLAAFLADVRDASAHARTLDPVLLLDNADNKAAVEFLRALEAVRTAPGAHRTPDHLMVVATTSGELLDYLGVPDSVVILTDADLDGAQPGPWLPVRLGDLAEREMAELATQQGVADHVRYRVARIVHELTNGHPGASALLMHAALAAGTDCTDLNTLLRQKVPDRPDGVPAGVRILDMWLRDVPDSLREDLITCAAAGTWTEADRLAARSELLRTPVSDRVAVLSRTYWSPRDPRGPKVMHPLLRRLLLEKLAERPAGHDAAWAKVFGWLADNAKGEPDRLRHQLATGHVAQARAVAARLTTLLTTQDGHKWLRLTESLVATPVPTTLTGDPLALVAEVAKDLPADKEMPVASVASLLVALRAIRDPMTIACRADLHAIAVNELIFVVKAAHSGFAAVVAESNHHKLLVEFWQQLLQDT
jgi:hypothetical protein